MIKVEKIGGVETLDRRGLLRAIMAWNETCFGTLIILPLHFRASMMTQVQGGSRTADEDRAISSRSGSDIGGTLESLNNMFRECEASNRLFTNRWGLKG